MLIKDQIIDKLQLSFNPSLLVVEDQSEMHRGHAGWNEDGESHFHIRISSGLFSGLSRIKQHRAIYEALTQKLVKKIHAISIEIISE
ncbi:MAG: BolA family transcriptional regulator [Paracoccaceae bacterium]|jgi:BolA protein|nr:BolA family transcriptional regulator [Paracoccaceae bacterium]